MKSVALLLLLSVSLAYCKKDNSPVSLKQNIQGSWELKTRYGGWIGTQNYPEGNGNTISFSNDAYIRVSVFNGIEDTDSGSYEVYTDTACNGIGETTYIKFIIQPAQYYVEDIAVVNNELVIGDNSCIADGVTSTYRRVQ